MKYRTPKHFYNTQFSTHTNFDKDKMSFGSAPYDNVSHRYGPRFYPPPYGPREHCGINPHLYTPENKSESWACDYCKLATFTSFEEASKHEKICYMNKNVLSGNISKGRHYMTEPRLLLCKPTDKQSLSDRQCYVRSQFVEMFEAKESDVSARHSKGAQRLRVGQIGIRCMHCAFLNSKNRAERATCYPSSISRIYQTVADMQRFHFEACTEIPNSMKTTYKSLKTTRPRGQGSPQAYWVASAKNLGLIDTSEGIRLSRDEKDVDAHPPSPCNTSSSMSSSISTEGSTPSSLADKSQLTPLPPLSPESQSSRTTKCSSSRQENDYRINNQTRDADANMLLSLRGGSALTPISR